MAWILWQCVRRYKTGSDEEKKNAFLFPFLLRANNIKKYLASIFSIVRAKKKRKKKVHYLQFSVSALESGTHIGDRKAYRGRGRQPERVFFRSHTMALEILRISIYTPYSQMADTREKTGA